MGIKKASIKINDSILTKRNRESRIVTKFFDKRFREAECPINSTQYDLMRMILTRTFTCFAELGKTIGMDRTTLSKRCKSLLNMGYLSLRLKDGLKKKMPSITQEGKELVVKYEQIYKQADADFKKECGED
jgi:DNA-binding MarR family transcriptional regulator